MLDEREAFLRAIFDEPENDLPRLVYADWLEEHGEEIAARAIRLSVEWYRCDTDETRTELRRQVDELICDNMAIFNQHNGVLRHEKSAANPFFQLSVDRLLEPLACREFLVLHPWSFQCVLLHVRCGMHRIADAQPLDTLYGLLAFRTVRGLNLDGDDEPIVGILTDETGSVIEQPVYDMRTKATITLAGVEALANHRGCSRLTSLSMCNNNLGNDALRYLAKSPYLDNLSTLNIAAGNNFRGRVWQLLIERFGEDVVS